MRIKSKNLNLDMIIWTILKINKTGEDTVAWINPHNVQHVCFFEKLRIITITMGNSDKFEIECDRDFELFKTRLIEYLIYKPFKH